MSFGYAIYCVYLFDLDLGSVRFKRLIQANKVFIVGFALLSLLIMPFTLDAVDYFEVSPPSSYAAINFISTKSKDISTYQIASDKIMIYDNSVYNRLEGHWQLGAVYQSIFNQYDLNRLYQSGTASVYGVSN